MINQLDRIGYEHARSWLLVPALDPDRYRQAIPSPADMIVLDLEDAVAEDAKAEARSCVKEILAEWNSSDLAQRLWIRVNAAGSHHWSADLTALSESSSAFGGIVLAKAENADEVQATADRLPVGTPIVALVESAAGLESATAIAAHPATVRLAFGSGDFRRDTGIGDHPTVLAYPRSRLTVASRAAGLPGPIDGPTRTHETKVLIRETDDAAMAGMTGRLCLRDNQTRTVNEGMSPTSAELDWANATVAESRTGNDPSAVPRLARARKIIMLATIFRDSAGNGTAQV